MARALRDPRGARLTDPRLLAIGGLLGAAALTRNEAVWLALLWVWLVLRIHEQRWSVRLRLIGVVAGVSLLVFAPWAYRDWVVFGSPLPGQAALNALSLTGFDIFAWNDPPTLERYLAIGPGNLAGMRVEGIVHNTIDVLVLLGFPISVIGLLALPWQGRDRALRPVLLLTVLIFLIAGLVFPVSTTWGTFLHAAAPVHVLLIVSAVGVLEAALAWLAARMGWTRPVTWLGALFAILSSAMLSIALLPPSAIRSRDEARTFAVLARQMAELGSPLLQAGPVIADQPIWLAEAVRIPALALPDEGPADVLDLARDARFRARWLVMTGTDHGDWPAILDSSPDPAAACFREVQLPVPGDPVDALSVEGVRVFRIDCAEPASP